ncbi:MAG TPA: serpin family protein [Bryobacteraceae bacterium]|jgi:serpin B|nr:serpin family protein [Bryobacteraceae bacterium]
MRRFVLPILFATTLPAADSSIPPALNAFTTACYQQLAPGNGNLILSPFNIATALSMLLAGARGQTAEEIQSVLHLRYDSTYDAALGSLLDGLGKTGNTEGNELHAANGLWVQEGFPIKPAFENTLTNDYHASVTPLDFIDNAEGARSRINSWTEEQTKEKIKNLLPAGSLDARTRLVLTSAIYFYGKWQNAFAASRTQPAPFTARAGTTIQANFMNQTFHTGYAETAGAQILEMRYAGTGIAFDVLLPKSPTGLRDVEKSLTVEDLTAWLASLTDRDVQVSLPKFRAESEFSLTRQLSAMGMPSAFSNHADFSGIEPNRGLQVSDVFHKAFVDVSEQGTEAAAATGIGIRATAIMRPEQPVVFRADHPFLFLIRDTHTGLILFIGRLMDPR